jgi:hypothetical protein
MRNTGEKTFWGWYLGVFRGGFEACFRSFFGLRRWAWLVSLFFGLTILLVGSILLTVTSEGKSWGFESPLFLLVTMPVGLTLIAFSWWKYVVRDK